MYLFGGGARLAAVMLSLGVALSSQTLDNKSLSGKYFFREMLLATDTSEARTLFGALTFDGNGNFNYQAQQLIGATPPASATGTGTYTVKSGGLATLSDPLRSGATLNARVGVGALVASDTEAGNSVFDLFIALPAPNLTTSPHLQGAYWIATLEAPNGNFGLLRETFFKATANGGGSFGDVAVTGQAVNLGDHRITQTVAASTFTLAGDGTGAATFPIAGAFDSTTQLLGGAKSLYVSADGAFFIGGGAGAGGHGMLVGLRAGANPASNFSLSGPYWAAGIRAESQNYSDFAGSVNALGDGRAVWSRRLRTSSGPADVSALDNYTINADGSGTALADGFAIADGGGVFVGSGVAPSGDTHDYELFFGVRTPAVSDSGLFLNPQGVFNVFSFAPAGAPISPGDFIVIYGSGFPPRAASPVPFPTSANGVQLLINNTPAAIYLSSAQLYAVVPYGVKGTTAGIVLVVNGARSNTIEVPLAATSPGVASIAQNGLGEGAITHADGSIVDSRNPAKRGETVVVYMTGLGAVSPAVADGTGAPSNPLATTAPVAVYVAGQLANVVFQGLTPGFAGLYQVNVTLPGNGPVGTQPLAVQTNEAFTDMTDIIIAP